MKVLSVLLFALSSQAAQSVTISEIFKDIKEGEKVCFARSYPSSHLKSHPRQSVKKIVAEIGRTKDEYDSYPYLRVEIYRKNRPQKKLTQYMSCFENEGGVMCSVDCDGGSMNIHSREESSLLLGNNGVSLDEGCSERVIYLENRKGGDDYFKLEKQDCK